MHKYFQSRLVLIQSCLNVVYLNYIYNKLLSVFLKYTKWVLPIFNTQIL